MEHSSDFLVGILGAPLVKAASLLTQLGCRLVGIEDDYIFRVELGHGALSQVKDGTLSLNIQTEDGNWTVVGTML